MSKSEVVRAVMLEGQAYRKLPDGTLVPLRDETDDARLAVISDDEAEAIAIGDDEGLPMTDEEWTRNKVASESVVVGLRLDRDVLQWFKGMGQGYQTAINTVLRRYMEAHRKPG
jgi:uncharacterized protein (DUF4415 family)